MIAADQPDQAKSTAKITLSGQVETMQESFSGLFSGMAIAVVFVFLLLVINFQSMTDALIVLWPCRLRFAVQCGCCSSHRRT